MMISLSILEYEPELSSRLDNISESRALSEIMGLIHSRKLYGIHIDVMRPPMIPDKTRFSIELIRQLYLRLHDETVLEIHLMVPDPRPLIREINRFVKKEERAKTPIIIQRESYNSEEEVIRNLKELKRAGYIAGVCLNLPTPSRLLTNRIVESADMILLMSVPMGLGGQRYSRKATSRIADLARRFPGKLIEVDGGIDPETVTVVKEAGAEAVVVGSSITRNKKTEEALEELLRALGEP